MLHVKGATLLPRRPKKWYGVLHSRRPNLLKKWCGFGRVCRMVPAPN